MIRNEMKCNATRGKLVEAGRTGRLSEKRYPLTRGEGAVNPIAVLRFTIRRSRFNAWPLTRTKSMGFTKNPCQLLKASGQGPEVYKAKRTTPDFRVTL